MPKAVKDHRSKKNPQAHEEWLRRKAASREGNSLKIMEQSYWRKDHISARLYTGKMTDKNWKEAETLGITIKEPTE